MIDAEVPATLSGAVAAIECGQFTPLDYVNHALQQIEAQDSSLNAFIHVDAEGARARARKLMDDRKADTDRLPLFGIPYAVKDNIDVKGLPTTARSRLLSQDRLARDASIVRTLERSGAILLGKTSLNELAIGGVGYDLPWPPTRNALNSDYTPGSSSSGSGVAVAAGMVPFAIGTDTGGSIRSPAGMNGVVGWKPSHDLLDMTGIFPLAPSQDTVGLIVRYAQDLRLMWSALQPAAVPVFEQQVSDLRIGSLRHFHADDANVTSDVLSAFENLLADLRSGGAKLTDTVTSARSKYDAAGWCTLLYESWQIHGPNLKSRPELFGVETRDILLSGAFVTENDYQLAQSYRTSLSAEIDEALEDSDILVAALSARPPCRLDQPEELAKLARASVRMPFSTTGHPVVVLPVGKNVDGLPFSVQLIGRRQADWQLISAAIAVQTHLS
ncbi:MAG: amidase [Pseudomonadota bacterium]